MEQTEVVVTLTRGGEQEVARFDRAEYSLGDLAAMLNDFRSEGYTARVCYETKH